MTQRSIPAQNGVASAINGIKQTRLERVIEDWEHNDPGQWQSDGAGLYDIESDTSFDGNYSARNVGVIRAWNHPNWGGLNHYPQEGDYWTFEFIIDSHNGQVRLYFGRTDDGAFDSSEGYEVHIYDNGRFGIEDTDGNELAVDYGTSFSTGTRYRVHHYWMHPDWTSDHVMELENVDSNSTIITVNGNNQSVTRSTGGLMLYANEGADLNFGPILLHDRTE